MRSARSRLFDLLASAPTYLWHYFVIAIARVRADAGVDCSNVHMVHDYVCYVVINSINILTNQARFAVIILLVDDTNNMEFYASRSALSLQHGADVYHEIHPLIRVEPIIMFHICLFAIA